jgi:hypothetical protein
MLELKRRNSSSLHEIITKANNKIQIVDRLPSEKRVNGWIEEAKSLSTIITS